MNPVNEWHPYEAGVTLGATGPHGGTVLRDEEHPYGARITLERDCLRVPFAITATVYGFGDHERFMADEPSAVHAYEQMKPALARILALVPLEDDPDYEAKYDAVTNAIEAFAIRFA